MKRDLNIEYCVFYENHTNFAGEGGLRKRVREATKTAIELFQLLEERGFLSKHNLLLLQQALYDIGRMDLVEMAMDYARQERSTVYFFRPSQEPGT